MIKKFKSIALVAFVSMLTLTSCDDSKKEAEEARIAAEKEATEMAIKAEEEAKMKEEAAREEAQANSIAAKAMATESLSTLVTALKAADLAPMMMEPGSYTVFAPSNTAFDALPSGTVETLVKPESKAALTDVLQYHVVQGSIDSAKLVAAIKENNGSYTFSTVGGGELTAMMSGGDVVIKDSRGKMSKVTTADVNASNGIVHIVDQVLMKKN
ncbi:fasciclin domain-containing protein [Dokdonia sp. Hel_I_53]|uniref:fasciclin domain-containing protein n=1 Tax=Dokdonia sp. Hel_I_53 TaxID=1566287 RepID=UPI00119A4C76|nr:fasciclin domain-containing protein [Dokdonia sp. Hel_I_53]TVZ51427.1 putative surface protein with fasciclin (FAS1) repeats [Dokdonia sp. Hel_I_53]